MGFIVLHPKFSNCKHDIFGYKHTSILTSIDKQSIYYIIYNFHNAHANSWIYKYIFPFFFLHSITSTSFQIQVTLHLKKYLSNVFLSKYKWPCTWRLYFYLNTSEPPLEEIYVQLYFYLNTSDPLLEEIYVQLYFYLCTSDPPLDEIYVQLYFYLKIYNF